MSEKLTCPSTASTLCGENLKGACLNGGLCCLETSTNYLCVCPAGYYGKLCHRMIRPNFQRSVERMQNAGLISAFSAVLGVLVIALFIVVIVLQVKYYRNRKKRQLGEQHEMDMKRDDSGKDSGYTKFLRTLPGYSWRKSVRHNSLKSKGPMWRSVPDVLTNGITIASFEIPNKQPNPRDPNQPGGQRVVTQASNAGNADSTTTTTAANASAVVPSDGKDAENMVHVEIEEDTVD